MRCVLTLVWYPWTATVAGPAQTQGVFRTLDRETDEKFARLPEKGEMFFFDDGGSAKVEAVGWKLDGTAYLYLGQKYEKDGEQLATWQARGFVDRIAVPEPAPAGQTAPIPQAPPADPGKPPATLPPG